MPPSRLSRLASFVKKPESAPAAIVVEGVELRERRRVPRALPQPDVVELDQDSGWALWQQSSFPADAAA